jgi:hypothetical protein
LSIYADSSFFVSLYVQDTHSASAHDLMKAEPRIHFSPLHFAECCHAVAQQVFYRRVSESDAQQIYRHMRSDSTAGIWAEIAIPDDAFERCAELARRHGAKLGVRTLDSLHVACALELKAERFWTFDDRQGKLAKAEGLKS